MRYYRAILFYMLPTTGKNKNKKLKGQSLEVKD